MDEEVQHILQSDLPNALQLTWIAMWGCSEDGLYTDSIAQVGRERGISRQGALKQVNRLVEWGAAEKVGNAYHLRVDFVNPEVDDRNPEDDDVNHGDKVFHFPASPLSPKKEYHSTPFHPSTPTLFQGDGDAKAPPLWVQRLMDRISWQAEPLPDDHPARWKYHPGDWRWEAGKYLLDGLRDHDVLHSGIDESRPDGAIASEWGDTMRLLHEQDGYHRKVISGTLWWLLNIDNWWIKNAIQSGSNGALRDRSGGGDDAHKFDKLVQRARRYYEQQQEQRIDPQEIHAGWGGDGEAGPEPARPAGNAVATGSELDEYGFEW